VYNSSIHQPQFLCHLGWVGVSDKPHVKQHPSGVRKGKVLMFKKNSYRQLQVRIAHVIEAHK